MEMLADLTLTDRYDYQYQRKEHPKCAKHVKKASEKFDRKKGCRVHSNW